MLSAGPKSGRGKSGSRMAQWMFFNCRIKPGKKLGVNQGNIYVPSRCLNDKFLIK